MFDGEIGNHNNNINDGGYYYAELSKNYLNKDFSALGKLPNDHKLKITYNGVSIIAKKGSVGAGG